MRPGCSSCNVETYAARPATTKKPTNGDALAFICCTENTSNTQHHTLSGIAPTMAEPRAPHTTYLCRYPPCFDYAISSADRNNPRNPSESCGNGAHNEH